MNQPAPVAMTIDFEHRHAAHCESGAFNALLRHRGLHLSEAMVFGIGSGLFFLYLPFFKIYGAPLVSYRDAPNAIMNRARRRLGVRLEQKRFRTESSGMRALDDLLADGIPAGMQTGVFWLPYFPRDMRFQFNGHHVVAYGKVGDSYLLSDTVFEAAVRCPAADLQRARFSRGPLAPRGFLYHVDAVDPAPDLAAAALAGMRTTAWRMLDIPIPYLGIRGVRTLGRAMARWPGQVGHARARSWLANVIRMQEEIGTGGAGFRFMYAAFLDEAADLLGKPALHELSRQLDEAGERWRDFAVAGADVIRDARDDADDFRQLATLVSECAQREESVFRNLRAAL